MYYSDSDDEIEYSKQITKQEEEDRFSVSSGSVIDIPFVFPETIKRTESQSRPQSGRAIAQAKALQLQEKRKAARTNSATGMVIANEPLSRTASAVSTSSKADIKDLIKERTQTVSITLNTK